ncbi:MAG: iron uptake transporter permease EfeU [Actinomycetota bacterium]
MGAAFLVSLREGIEAALIISILLAYLRQIDRNDMRPLVWWGTGLAVLVSLAVGGVIFAAAAEFEGTGEKVFEGLVTLAAVGVLTWMIFWMRRQGARVKSELQDKVDAALMTGGLALGGLAFVTVVREGIETALFIFAAAKGTAVQNGRVWEQLLGAALGLALAVALGVLLYRGGLRMNLRTFFRYTGALLIVVAAGLFGFGIHELQEAGWLPFLTSTAFDISRTIPDDSGVGGILRALFGYQANPTWLEVVSWFGYLVTVGWFFLRPPAVPGASATAPDPTAAAAAVAGSDSRPGTTA